MFKILLVILALAIYGAHSLLASFNGNPPPSAEAPSGLGAMALSAVAGATGISIAPLPDTGCQDSALSQDNLTEIFATLPDVQREALSRLIDWGASVVTVQLYTGPDGIGLCLPAQGRLVLLPARASQVLTGVAGNS